MQNNQQINQSNQNTPIYNNNKKYIINVEKKNYNEDDEEKMNTNNYNIKKSDYNNNSIKDNSNNNNYNYNNESRYTNEINQNIINENKIIIIVKI